MLLHPRAADLARDPIRVLGRLEVEDEDQVRVVDPDETGGEPSGVDHPLQPRPCSSHRFVTDRLAQVEVVDDDVHEPHPNSPK